MDLEGIFQSLHKPNDFLCHCERFVSLAEMCKSDDFFKKLEEADNFGKIWELVKLKANDTNVLLFCKVLFLCALTQHQLHIKEAKNIEILLFEFIRALNCPMRASSDFVQCYEIHLQMLPTNLQDVCSKLCENILLPTDIIDIAEINVSFLCLRALENICCQIPDWQEPDFISCSLLFQVLEKFHTLIISPAFSMCYNLSATDSSYDFHIVMIKLCLRIFEGIFFKNPHKQKAVLDYQDNLFLKCMCRLLAYCLKALFKKESLSIQSADDLNFEKNPSVVSKYVHLHQTCLVSALKVLLNIHPNYGAGVYEITTALMEKLLICFLETSYSSLGCKFELCLMTLELMVNLTEFEVVDRKQFAKLCLMKFNIGKFTYLSVEVLIKVLTCTLKRIISLGSIKKPEEGDHEGALSFQMLSTNTNLNSVYHVAEEHMEHSFICSYICVFLSYFCDIKQPFFVYVSERLPVEMAETAVIVMSKFKEFIPLMGKQNGQAFNMLDRAIRIFLGMTKQQQ